MPAQIQNGGTGLDSLIEKGESATVEFKRCGNGIQADVWESACAFLNRFGGDIYLGVEDDGSVSGIPQNSVQSIVSNAINCAGNPDLFQPPFRVDSEILPYDDRFVVRLHIDASPSVSRYEKDIYDRRGTADVRVFNDDETFALYLRKKGFAAERQIVPEASLDDLRLDLLPQLRRMAVNTAAGRLDPNGHSRKHPWSTLSDRELPRSAGLIAYDSNSGKDGLVLAAVLLLGRDEIIRETLPGYATDVIVKRINADRYDDRLIVTTNLIESYEQIVSFAASALPDKFFLEGMQRVSLSGILVREIVANTLIHREFSSPLPSRFVIEQNKMFVENPNRALSDSRLTPTDFVPLPKNPIIGSFFRNIGYADQLGSGVRNVFRRSRQYSGADPVFQDGDMFRISVPLNDSFVPVEVTYASGKEISQSVPRTNQTSAANQVLPATNQALPGANQALPGANQALPGTNQALPGTNQALPGTNQVLPGTNQVLPGTNQALPGTNQALPGTNQALPGTNQMPAGTNQAPSGTNQALPGMDHLDIAKDKRSRAFGADGAAGSTRLRILKTLIDAPGTRQTKLSENLGIPLSSVKYHVLALRRAGCVEHVGPRNGGTWKVNHAAVNSMFGAAQADRD